MALDELTELEKMFEKILKENRNLNFLDENDMSPLMMAVESSAEKYVTQFLAKGADPNFQNSKGNTALFYIPKFRNALGGLENMQYADINAFHNENIKNILIRFVGYNYNYRIQNEEGNTALHLYVKRPCPIENKMDLIDSLPYLTFTNNVNIENKNKETALDIIAKYSNRVMLDVFMYVCNKKGI